MAAVSHHRDFFSKAPKTRRFVFAVLLAVLCGSIPARANLIVNGSFEQGAFVGPGLDILAPGSTGITGWTAFNEELAWFDNAAGEPSLVASDGVKFLDLTGGRDAAPYGGVQQTIVTTPGQLYLLEFDLGANYLGQGESNSVTASAGGASSIFTNEPGQQWQRFGLPFTATSGSTLVSLVGSGAGGNGAYIGLDNVSVTPEQANIIDATYGAGAGSFELGTYVDNGFGYMTLAPDATTITGWTVGGPGNGVEWLTAPAFGVDTGIHPVDLQATTDSSIATVIPTVTGDVYELTFAAATALSYGNATGVVSAGSLVNQPFTAVISSDFSTQTFTPFAFLFTATGPTTTIQFTATGPNTSYGPVIDSVSVVLVPCVPPPSGLVSWWPGEGYANDIIDGNSGGPRSGESFTATSFAPAEVGQGFSFSSDSDGVTIPHNDNLNVQSPGFTADFWMKGDKNQPQDIYTVLEKSHGAIDSTGWLFAGTSSSTSFGFAVGAGGGSNNNFTGVGSTVDVLDGNFHHIAGTWDGANLALYVDGALQGLPTPLSTPANNNRSLNVGYFWGGPGGTPGRFFRGVVDEIQIFNRALSGPEVQAIFNAGSGGQCKPAPSCVPPLSDSLVSWWRGEGNGNDATGANNDDPSQTVVSFDPGEVGQAFSFDGQDGTKVTIPHDPSLTPSQLTIEAWIKPTFNGRVSRFCDADFVLAQLDPAVGYAFGVDQNILGCSSFSGDGQGRIGFFTPSSPNSVYISAGRVRDDGAYHHIATTYDGATLRFYIDGALDPSEYNAPNLNLAATGPAYIGYTDYGNDPRPAFAAIDAISLYSRALSPAEIQAIFNAMSAGKCTGVCGNGIVEPGEQCDDGNTGSGDGCSDRCQIETCYTCSGVPSVCTPADGTPCDDGVFCNGTDSCSGGTCSVHGVDPCASGAECNNVCNEAARNCVVPAGRSCSDDGNVCTDDVCDGAGHCGVPNTAPCDDGLFCNGTDTCSGGTCSVHGVDPCLSGPECANTCDETSGTCLTPAGTSCSSDDNPCTVDACDGSGTCAHQPGNAGELCRPAAGQCDAAESCDGVNSTCPADASKPDGTTCDDSNACTQSDQCVAGICKGTPIPNCRVCGDGIFYPGEQCDDGNTTAGDGCDSNCHYELIPGDGNGSSTLDQRACRLEWSVVNPKNSPATDKHGRPHFIQTCRNGDLSCDFGSDADACEFRVVACLNNVDPHLPNCPASGVGDSTRVMLFGAAGGSQNHTAMMSALDDLRDPASGLSGFKLPLNATQVGMCTKPFSVRVALRGSGRKRHAGRVKLLAVSRAPRGAPAGTLVDIDRLTFVCTP